jgi:hypothetical protein
MRPVLHREHVEPNEARLARRMARLVVAGMKPQGRRIRRAQHAKATGCVRATFAVREDVPTHLRHGVFGVPGRSFEARVRFSSSSETIEPDGRPAGRGMAIKLLGVDGTPAAPEVADGSQDFLLVNHPTFPLASPADYVRLFTLREAPLVGGLLSGVWLLLFRRRALAIVNAIRRKALASPLESTYWSGSPYWLGSADGATGSAVKYSVVPRFARAVPPDAPGRLPDDYLGEALARHVREREADFDFRVQLQADPEAMPVEDPSVAWDEAASPPIPVATLTVERQDVGSPEGRALAEECESLTFSPWHALAEHRPMGGINRLRRAVYRASQARRLSEAAH